MKRNYIAPGIKIMKAGIHEEILADNTTSIFDLYNPEDIESEDGIPMH